MSDRHGSVRDLRTRSVPRPGGALRVAARLGESVKSRRWRSGLVRPSDPARGALTSQAGPAAERPRLAATLGDPPCLQARGYGKARAGISLVGTAGLARLGPRGSTKRPNGIIGHVGPCLCRWSPDGRSGTSLPDPSISGGRA